MKLSELFNEEDNKTNNHKNVDYNILADNRDHMDIDALIKYIKPYEEKVKLFIQKSTKIFRGMKNTGDIILADGSKINRVSTQSENYHNLIIDSIPAFNGYPKRSNSFIAVTNDYRKRTMYGELYICITLENQPIGICPTVDIWNSFVQDNYKNAYTYIAGFNQHLTIISNMAGVELSNASFSDFMNGIDKIDEFIIQEGLLNKPNSYRHVKSFLYAVEAAGSVKNLIKQYYQPLGFDVQRADAINVQGEREVWFSGKTLFIHNEYINALEEYFK